MAICDVEGCKFAPDPGYNYDVQDRQTLRHFYKHVIEQSTRQADTLEGLLMILTQLLQKVNLTNEAPETILRGPAIRERIDTFATGNGAGAPIPVVETRVIGEARPGMCGECGFHMMSMQHRAHITGVAKEVK